MSGLPKRCSVCRRTGHTNRAHASLSGPELAALKQDGLDFMGRGFRELGEQAPNGDLFDVLRADTERDLVEAEPATKDLLGALQASVDRARADRPQPITAAEFARELAGTGPKHDPNRPVAVTGAYDDQRVLNAIREATPITGDDVARVHDVPAELLAAPARYVETDDIGLHTRREVVEVSSKLLGGEQPDLHPDHLDVCTECLGEIAFRPVLSGRAWGHTDDQHADDVAGDHDVRVRWDPATTGPLRLLTWRLPDQTVMYGHGEHGPQFAPWRTPLGPDGPKLITLPGVYDLDAAEYHDPDVTGDWLSNSDARQLVLPGCPAQFRYNQDNRVHKTSEAFAVGHAVHARVLGKGESIAVRPEKWDSWRTNAAKAWRAEQEAAGRSVILPEQAEFVEAMAEAVHLKQRAHELLSQPGRPEMCLFWVDPETGVRRRCMVDYLPSVVDEYGVMEPVDLKSADSVAPDESMERKLYDHAWHRQGTTIADGIVALGLAREVEFYFIVQSKTPPHLVTIVKLDADAERIGRIENRQALLVYKRCLETGVWPDYAEHPVTLSVPQWIARAYEEDVR